MRFPESKRVVVVTGANEGIGYHLLVALLEDGYRVAGLDVDGDAIELLRETYPGRVRYYDCDGGVDADVESAVLGVIDEWGWIDRLVNTAAVLNFEFFEDQSLADAKRVFGINYFGYVRRYERSFRICERGTEELSTT